MYIMFFFVQVRLKPNLSRNLIRNYGRRMPLRCTYINWKYGYKKYISAHNFISVKTLKRVSEASRKNKKGGVIIPDDNIT